MKLNEVEMKSESTVMKGDGRAGKVSRRIIKPAAEPAKILLAARLGLSAKKATPKTMHPLTNHPSLPENLLPLYRPKCGDVVFAVG